MENNNQAYGDITQMSSSEIAAQFENVLSVHQGRLYLLDRNWSVAMAIAVFGLPTLAIIVICLLRMRLSHIENHMNVVRNDKEAVSLLTLEDGSHIALLGQRSESDQDSVDLDDDPRRPLKPGQGHSSKKGNPQAQHHQYGRHCSATIQSSLSSNTEETLVVVLTEESSTENTENTELPIQENKKKTIRFALNGD